MAGPPRIDYRNPQTPESIDQDFSEGWVKGLVFLVVVIGFAFMTLVWFAANWHD